VGANSKVHPRFVVAVQTTPGTHFQIDNFWTALLER